MTPFSLAACGEQHELKKTTYGTSLHTDLRIFFRVPEFFSKQDHFERSFYREDPGQEPPQTQRRPHPGVLGPPLSTAPAASPRGFKDKGAACARNGLALPPRPRLGGGTLPASDPWHEHKAPRAGRFFRRREPRSQSRWARVERLGRGRPGRGGGALLRYT